MKDWPEAVEQVAGFLRDAGAEARVEEFATPTPTAQAAADAIGCELRQIVKSLLFECDDGRPVVALVPGDRRADAAKVAAAATPPRLPPRRAPLGLGSLRPSGSASSPASSRAPSHRSLSRGWSASSS